MANEIEWSERARIELFEILKYWANRNKSKSYSISLNQQFLDGVELLVRFPESGIRTGIRNVRIKIIRDYFVYYHIGTTYIEILTIWDSRRDPKKFKL